MDIDPVVTKENENTNDGESSPPAKRRKDKPVDPIKQILGRAQTYLNQEFVYYYKNVGLFSSEAEWEEFSDILYKELPTTFRITRNTSFTSIIQTYMEELFCSDEIGKYEIGGKLAIEAPRAMKWYPEGLGYHFEASRKSMRLSSLTKHLKHFLTHETEIGNISRQEAVSMVPPLLLDVQSHHKVLDMCAAPGSKTCQLLEMLHQGAQHQTPTGFVMANDANMARCYLLAHQTHRLASPAIVVTHYDATQFPLIELSADAQTGQPKETLQFDRILCDVPCSGDGTVRKNPGAASGWDHSKPFKLFKLQLAIAQRAAQLLKIGGRMVYSTCAFNPIEDEAVVAQLLRESQGALRIVNVAQLLPDLIRKPGISHWKVIDGHRKTYTSPSDIPEQTRARIPDAVFPPTEDEVANFHLEYCLRFYPHMQDTGGFFVAVLEKTGETHFNSNEAAPNLTELGLEDDAKEPKPERGFSEDPFYSLPSHVAESVKKGLREYYGIQDVEGEEFRYLLMRSANDPNTTIFDGSEAEPPKKVAIEDINMIYKTSAPVHDLLRRTRGIRFVSAGVRFVENFSKRNKHLTLACEWRVTAEGLLAVAPYLTRHVIQIGLEDFKLLLKETAPKFEQFSAGLSAQLTELAKDGVGVVSIKIVPEPISEGELAALSRRERALRTTTQWVMGWLGKASLNHAIPKLELKSWRNFYLTSDYSFEFNPKINTITDEEKAVLIETNRAKKAEREAQRKEANRAEKAKRRNDRRKAMQADGEQAPAQISADP